MSLILSSPAFHQDENIATRFTCDGSDVSPPLAWEGVPATTKSLALVVEDPDAPDPAAPQRTFVHWVVYDIPPDCHSLQEGVEHLPEGAKQGTNDWNRAAYGGPCPPKGKHRYFFKLYALDKKLGDLDEPSKAQLEMAMQGHIIEQTALMGTYQRPGH